MKTNQTKLLPRWLAVSSLVAAIALSIYCGEDPSPSNPGQSAGDNDSISLSTANVAFNAVKNGAIPSAQAVQITRGGNGLGLNVNYGGQLVPMWLDAQLSSTSAPATISLAVVTTDLDPGSYIATVSVVSMNGAATKSIQVTYTVATGTPQIALSLASVTFNATVGGGNPSAVTVAITNGGSGDLTGLTASVAYQGGQPAGWLPLSLFATSAPTALRLDAITGSLPVGTYNATVSVASSVASNSPQTIAVTFNVTGTPPTTGSIKVNVATGGQDLDPTGYVVKVTVGGGLVTTQNVNANGFVVFSDIAPGGQTVTLQDVASNCVVGGSNPRTVTVVAGTTVETTFNVTCSGTATTGSIRVNVATGGQNLDTGYVVAVSLGGGLSQLESVSANGFVVVSNLGVGSHTVTLQDVASNCVVGGSNPRTVTVVAGSTVETTFSVTCSAPTTGSIKVNVATGGQGLDTGYVVKATVGGGLTTTQNVDANGYVVFSDIAPGSQTVTLQDVASNCVVGGSNPRTVTVVAGNTVETTFSVTCTSTAPRRVRIFNNIDAGLHLQQVVQVKVAATEPNVYVRSDLLTDDPADCVPAEGEAIDRGASRTFDITIGNNYSMFIGIGNWDQKIFDDGSMCLLYEWSKIRFFTDPNYYLYYVWAVVNFQGHDSGDVDLTITGSYLNGTLKVTGPGLSLPFNLTQYNPIP